MLSAEYGEFEATIKQLEKVFGKALDDETIKAYWHALRDIHLETLKRCADRHQKHGKFFPKPVELRPKDEKLPIESNPIDFQRMVNQSTKMWQELQQEDPELARLELGIARCARMLVMEHPGSTQYAMAQAEDRYFRDARYALWGSRAKAVA